ncbi:hypothetical protein F5876DRAFT_73271 [Lentinula aff. lateritia]|uniref:Uncharacterized protein n=1 Tax=Lentinula aff. lateritia TaxID=2804960 RepID=A0ACC1UAA8_9AGAR|nr:hypothetical protein F5876DRAFT_73271 [Lentinula aff. lateritia]
MDNAWQPQDVAPPPPSGGDMNGVEDSGRYGGSYNNGPRRSSRSRSPGGDNRDRVRDRGRRDGGQDNNPGNNLHVSGLSSKVDDRELEAMFAKVGRITKAQVVYDPHTRESRGFGFVTMETPEEADAAVTALNNTELYGKTVTARRGRARTPTPGKYFGPTKRRPPGDRPYDPRPYDSRYSRDRDRDYDRRDRGDRAGRYDDSRRDRDYDKPRDRDRGGDRGGGDRYRDYDRGDREKGGFRGRD